MEEASKRQAEQDEWLKKFYQSTEASRETHDKIIQGLEGKEIKYFSANSGFSDNEEQETDDSGMAKAVVALKATLNKKREEPKKVKQNVNYYVDPYEPQIPFPKRLEHHVEEELDIRMLIILGRPLLATAHVQVDIFRKTISLEVGSEKVIFKILSSFTTTNFESVCSIKSETFIEDDNLKEIDYDLFLYDSESCEFNQLLCINPDIFSYEIDIHESYEEIVYKITNVENEKYSAPQEKKEHWCREILQEKENESQYWASCNLSSNICDGGDLPINVEKYYWKSDNDSKREELEWENLSLNDWMRIRYGKVCKMTEERILEDYWRERFRDEEDDLDKNLEDPEECGEDKANTILGVIHDKLNNDWFNNTSKDEDDLEGILDYLKPRSYDGFIDLDDEAYNKRRCRLLGLTYEEPTPILIEKAKVTRYIVGPGETYTKFKVLGVEKIPRIRDNVAAMRAKLMKKMAQEGNNQAKT
ncbi:hypothetical protein Tco_1070219 [Tanacetum coccineum]|uniref:Uncharacterized protein n=1 Tax=Tanacetum coccineum TaxID=301880 RepID=A0ABQ5HKP5_9ASTR